MLPPEAMGGAGVRGRRAPCRVGAGGGPLKTPHAFVVFPVWAESSRKVRTSVSVVHGRISSLWKGAWYAAGALCLLSE